jgi:8-amino-7-oxononanoate synthase
VEALSPGWDTLAPQGSVGLERGHISAAERAALNDAEPWYLEARRGEALVGIGHFFLLDMDLARLGSEISPPVRRALQHWIPGFLKLRVVECGFLTALGEGLAARGPDAPATIAAMAQQLERTGRARGGDVAILRDVPFDERERYAGLRGLGWIPVLGFPRAVMELEHESFDGWLEALKKKRRVEVKRTLRRLDHPGVEIVEIPHFADHAARLAELWWQVHDRANDYEHEVLSETWFREIDGLLPERSSILAIREHERIVGYFLLLRGDRELFAAHCGLDYARNNDLAAYPNLYLATLRHAYAQGAERLNLGITTYGIKHGLGARSEPLVYWVKHLTNPSLTPAFAELLRRGIHQPVNGHRPYGAATPRPRDLAADARALVVRDGSDVFRQAQSYHRIDLLRFMGLYAFCPPFEGAQEPTVEHGGQPVIMLGTNSYLGLGAHPRLRQAAREAIDRYGTGCSGSPLLNGTTDLHLALARELAAFLGKEDVLLLSTGYQTNLGVLFGLLNFNDAVILDERSHASLVDGAQLCGAKLLRYRHRDMDSLEQKLRQAGDRPTLVVSDGLFSMEGCLAPLPEIVALTRRHGARLLVDDAHGIGALGPGGRGSCEHFGLLDQVELITGTFSKCFAAVGGFVAGPARVLDHLRHESRPHVFSASLPPAVVATVREALAIVREEPERRAALLHNARYLARGLSRLGYPIDFQGTPILALPTGDELLTLGLYHTLLERGVYTNPVLSPAVPKGSEQLRLSVMASHTHEDIERALEHFATLRCPSFPLTTRTEGARP